MTELPESSFPLEDVVSPNETPEELRQTIERLQNVVNELFAKKAAETEADLLSDKMDSTSVAVLVDSQVAFENTDRRLYVPVPEGWEVRIKTGIQDYCQHRIPGEDGFHLILIGELYLQFGKEKVCLNCAHRHGVLTDDRLFWQHGRHRRSQLMNPLAEPTVFTPASESLTSLPLCNDSHDVESIHEITPSNNLENVASVNPTLWLADRSEGPST